MELIGIWEPYQVFSHAETPRRWATWVRLLRNEGFFFGTEMIYPCPDTGLWESGGKTLDFPPNPPFPKSPKGQSLQARSKELHVKVVDRWLGQGS